MTPSDKFARNYTRLIQFADKAGIKVLCTALWRDAATQLMLFYAKQSKCDGIKNISMHQLGRAADLAILNEDGTAIWDSDERYFKLGEYWESIGGTWGHRWFEKGTTEFDDLYHFEM